MSSPTACHACPDSRRTRCPPGAGVRSASRSWTVGCNRIPTDYVHPIRSPPTGPIRWVGHPVLHSPGSLPSTSRRGDPNRCHPIVRRRNRCHPTHRCVRPRPHRGYRRWVGAPNRCRACAGAVNQTGCSATSLHSTWAPDPGRGVGHRGGSARPPDRPPERPPERPAPLPRPPRRHL